MDASPSITDPESEPGSLPLAPSGPNPPPEPAERPSELFSGPSTPERGIFYLAAAFHVFALPFVWTWAIIIWVSSKGRPGPGEARRNWLRAAILLGSFDLILAGIAGGRWSSELQGLSASRKDKRELGVVLKERESHILVERVLPSTPADLMGLRPGDEINAVDGRPVRSISELKASLASPGDGKEVSYFRDGALERGKTTLGVEPEYLAADRRGGEALGRGDLSGARRSFERAREIYPGPGEDVGALRGLALVREREGDLDGSRTLLERAFPFASDSERDGLRAAGLGIALRSRDAGGAEHHFEEIEDPELKRSLGPSVLLLEGKTGKAWTAWLGWLARSPLPAIFPAILMVLLVLSVAGRGRWPFRVEPGAAGAPERSRGAPWRSSLRLFKASAEVLAGALVLGLLGGMLYGWLAHSDPFAATIPTLYPPDILATAALEPLGLLILTVLAHRSLRGGPPLELGWRALPPAKLLGGALAALCILYGINLRAGMAALAIRGLDEKAFTHPVHQLAAMDFRFFLWLLPSVALIGPIAEEAFFRGFLHVHLRERLGPAWAIAGSAVVFGLLHPISTEYVITSAGLGLALGYIRERSGSLLPPILAHCLFNAAGFALPVLAGHIP